MKKNLKRKLLLGFAFILISKGLMAQSVEVHFPKSEPEKVKWIAQAKLFEYEFSSVDPLRIGLGLAGDYFLPKMLSVHADFNTTYLQIADVDQQTFNDNQNKLAEFTFGQACVRLHLMDKIGVQKMKIETGREDYGSHVIVHSLIIPFPARKIFAVRGGLFMDVEPVSTDYNSINTPFADGKAGIMTTDGKKWGGSGDPVFTNMYEFGVFGGLSFMSIINATYNHEGSGDYIKRRFRETYIDVMYAPSITFGDIKTSAGTSKITPNTSGSFKTSNIGGRVGLTILNPHTVGVGYGFEIGVRPGIQNYGFYFGTRVTLVIANSLK